MKELSNTPSTQEPDTNIKNLVKNAVSAGLNPDAKDSIEQDREPENNK